MERGMRYQFLDKVRVRPVSGLSRFFAGKERRQMINRIGTVVSAENGKLSKRPLYTVSFENKKICCFFEDELEPAAVNK